MKKRLFTILFTILVTVVFVAPISLVYLLTKSQVALNEEVFLKKSVLYAAGIPLPKSNSEVVTLYLARAEEVKDSGGNPLYFRIKAEEASVPAGYVFIRTGPGLWGDIMAMVGFDKDLERLTGVDFLKQSETPGLGARISESWFREQFRGKKGPFDTVAEGVQTKENEFDALTGASITSNAVKSILNSAIDQVRSLVQ